MLQFMMFDLRSFVQYSLFVHPREQIFPEIKTRSLIFMINRFCYFISQIVKYM